MRSGSPSLARAHAATTQLRASPARTRATAMASAAAPSSASRTSSRRYAPAAGDETMLLSDRPSTRSCAATTTASTSAKPISLSSSVPRTVVKINSCRLRSASRHDRSTTVARRNAWGCGSSGTFSQ
jgi:hypothetical protein